MSDENPEAPKEPAAGGALDFDRAEYEGAAHTHVECAACKSPIADEYWQAAGKILCGSCRGIIKATADRGKSGATFGKAMLFGGGAGIAGGAAYAVFVGLTNIQFALITIGIGWLVGRAIQKATLGFGSLKHQILAVVITYFAATMGYLPGIFKGISNAAAERQQTAQSATGEPPDEGAPKVEQAPARPVVASLAIVAGLSIAVMLAAPFFGLTSGVSGLLGLAIIFFGLRTAWRTAKGSDTPITGPHRLGATV